MSNNIETKLWDIANTLRGTMDSSEYKNYILGFIFYRYLSDKVNQVVTDVLAHEQITTYEEAYKIEDYKNELNERLKEEIGYCISPWFLFSSIVDKINTDEFELDNLAAAFDEIERSTINTDAEDDFRGLFSDIDLTNNKIGHNVEERELNISKIIISINEIDFDLNMDVLGSAYEYLLKQFASDAGKKGGEFYTPSEVSTVVAKLVSGSRERAISVYDPTCGSGSLLLKAHKEMKGNISYIYGQELNSTTFNLARMNMFLHGIKFSDFQIKQGNTLTNDKFEDKRFDMIVANPPFGTNWDPNPGMLGDPRFAKYGKLAPKSKGEFAFLQHMLFHLEDHGVMASVVPHGVLFRGAAELTIRRYMIETDNCIDAVIGLPANLFYGTGIPACIIVFKKCRTDQDILFIDASNEFEKVKTQNVLTNENINKIIDTYTKRSEIDKYSKKVLISEIVENEYNLNIPRYIDTFEEEEPIDIKEVNNNIKKLKAQIETKEIEIEKMLKDLGL